MMASRQPVGLDAFLVGILLALTTSLSQAEKRYSPGAHDAEIRIGQTTVLSGPASSHETIARAQPACFTMLNAKGGINARRIKLISPDDGFNPARTVEKLRQLVEHEQVLPIINPLGASSSIAVQRYLNQRQVPQRFVAAGGARFGDHEQYPWTPVPCGDPHPPD